MKLTRRLFSGLAAVAPAALARAPAGLALGMAMPPRWEEDCQAEVAGYSPRITTAVRDLWDQISQRRDKRDVVRKLALREAAGILDPEIQALTACSPVYRMHLQLQKDERAESIIQKLRDRIEKLEKLGQ